jgi:hypothetical protein
MTALTIEEMENKLRELAAKEAEAETLDDADLFLSAELAYGDQLDVYCEALNTTEITTKGIRNPDGTYEQVQSWIHTAVGCVGAQCIDLNRWRLHHLSSGFLVGCWSGNRVELLQFLPKLDALLGQVSADPNSEDRVKMKQLGNQARAMGVGAF